ncbi:MAG: hypothetical protein GY866_31160 [Proteobacteria bacterium]|nr:hypothetical protein [Pseudomonadota bacterium]
MPTNRPSKQELVEAVREFLENKIQPAIEGGIAFHTRIAINILKIVERELEFGPGLDAQEHERLGKLLGKEGSLDELNAEFCRRLREEDVDYGDKDLIEHLRLTAIGKLSMDNPKYSAYKRVIGETAAE